MRFLNLLKVKIIEIYQRQKIKQHVKKKFEDEIFREELKKFKTESKKENVKEIRTKAQKAAKITNKGVPASVSKAVVGGLTELNKGKESLDKITKGLDTGNRNNLLKIDTTGKGLDDLIGIKPRKKSENKKKGGDFSWSLE